MQRLQRAEPKRGSLGQEQTTLMRPRPGLRSQPVRELQIVQKKKQADNTLKMAAAKDSSS